MPVLAQPPTPTSTPTPTQNNKQPEKVPKNGKPDPEQVPPSNSADGLQDDGSGSKDLNITAPESLPPASGIIPAGSGIVAKTLLQIVTDPARKYAVPITMVTILPIYDSNGNPIIPAATLLNGRIEKREGGDEIIVESLLYKGRVVSLDSIGKLVPAQLKPESFGQFVTPAKSKASTVFESLRDASLTTILLSVGLSDISDSGRQNVNTLLITALATDLVFRGLAALTDKSPKPIPPIVDIPQNSILVFALRKDLILPDVPAQNTPLPTTEGVQP